MKLYKIVLFGSILLNSAMHGNSFARELHGRIGLGYNSQYSASIPGISVKYGLTKDLHLNGVLGFATSSPAQTLFALKGLQNIFTEVNLNFYGLLGAAYISGNARSSYEVLGGFGSEFFIPGLESLGFSVELGLSLTNISGSTVLKTMGAHFLNAGIHFYF
jgi:hypothetical protein